MITGAATTMSGHLVRSLVKDVVVAGLEHTSSDFQCVFFKDPGDEKYTHLEGGSRIMPTWVFPEVWLPGLDQNDHLTYLTTPFGRWKPGLTDAEGGPWGRPVDPTTQTFDQ